MFWSYIGNFRKILGCIQNQSALIHLHQNIKFQKGKNLAQSFSLLMKEREFNEFNEYVQETENNWIFYYPFENGYALFSKNESLEDFEEDIKSLISEQSMLILDYLGLIHLSQGIFDLQPFSCFYRLPDKTKTHSTWFWISDIFFSAEFLVFLFFIFFIMEQLFFLGE